MFFPRRLLFAAGIAITAMPLWVTAAPQKPITSITTTRGQHYEGVQILKVYPDGLAIRHASGAAKIPFTQLSEELRQRFRYEPEAARSYAQETALADEEARQKVQEARAAQQQKEAEIEEAARRALAARPAFSSGTDASGQALSASLGSLPALGSTLYIPDRSLSRRYYGARYYDACHPVHRRIYRRPLYGIPSSCAPYRNPTVSRAHHAPRPARSSSITISPIGWKKR